MKVLLDQNISAVVGQRLRARGTDAIHTREVGLANASDATILDWCRDSDRIVVTRDADFHALLAVTGATVPSVVRIRIEPLLDEGLVRIIEWLLQEKRNELESGVAVTVKGRSTRFHKLPLLSNEGSS
ncbi:MAG TPA: DUF5615 family PIN-like protein [Thermoanaerobaculia bacterium]|jgi:predicted nuclease of predicted toxin-antitoxin system